MGIVYLEDKFVENEALAGCGIETMRRSWFLLCFDEWLGSTDLSPFSFSSSSKYENSLHESKSYLQSETRFII
jgi:hypothetical protein